MINGFAAAISIGGAAGGVQGWNFRATVETGEPYPGATSVWYRWTAPASSTVIFSLSSPDTAVFLGVYTGDTPADLVQRAAATATAGGEATLSGVFVETDDRTGLAVRVAMVRQGGRLQEAAP